MSDKKDVNNSISNKSTDYIEKDSQDSPIKPCYFLADRHFIVIDSSIIQQLNFAESSTELYFQQEIDEDSCIILRPYKMKG